jgi:hypothetical protein
MEITKEHTDVIGRGIYPDSKESCSYYIEFKNTPAVLFDIVMLAGVSWHYNAENPNESSFMKKMGDENVNIPLTSCSVHTQKGHIVALTCTTWNKNFCMGLARLPTDLECWQYIKSQLSPQDCALLDRKRLNQKKAAAEAAPPAAEAAPPAAEAHVET